MSGTETLSKKLCDIIYPLSYDGDGDWLDERFEKAVDKILALFTDELRKAFYDCHRWEADRRLALLTTGDHEVKAEAARRYPEVKA